MVVLVTNVTDVAGSNPVQVDIYNKTLPPGGHIRIPADLVNAKLRALEERGLIAIGSLPPWYEAAKKRKGRALSKEEMEQRIVTPPPAPTIKPVLKDLSKELPKEPSEEQFDELSARNKRRG